MLSVDHLQVAEEEVVDSSSNKLGDIYTFVAKGCFPQTTNPLRKKNLKRYAQKFIIDDGKLYYVGPKKEEKREVVIEAERKRQIFLDCHFNDIGHHLGQKKTVHRIQSKYYWLGIIKDVVDWIKVCETCQHAERNKNMARTVRPIKVDAPWDIVGIDIIGPFPETQQCNTHAAVLIDYFSKWPEAFPVQKTDAVSVARCISKCMSSEKRIADSKSVLITLKRHVLKKTDQKVIVTLSASKRTKSFSCHAVAVQTRFGAPKTVVCTQSAEFCDEVTNLLSNRWGIVQKVSPLAQPQLNPLHDCTSPLLKEAIREMVKEKQADWDDFLDPLLFLFRTSINPTTKFTPYSLMFNRKANNLNQATFGPLGYDDEQDLYSVKEKASTYMTIMQEQQDTVKQLVIANMKAAYKQEKSVKRKAHSNPSVTLKTSEPPFCVGDPHSSKKLKEEGLYLSFPVETVLATEQTSSQVIKTELTYHFTESDVH
ncbi:gypsy retrotransposon integrase-like protein 1 isoform X2 [Syngnathoides biaculeatus]|uniref:gypsy retrotransposon integrase-like protein 1 isoform X2 n=1 Tax=Syngnathoides biaculeatus TaxID=300417 RepID=UPI002ADE8568|nr:gypsy retrotransposon integrase-like protein 1 isoform X2 [Syngnathoides biaculeatus]